MEGRSIGGKETQTVRDWIKEARKGRTDEAREKKIKIGRQNEEKKEKERKKLKRDRETGFPWISKGRTLPPLVTVGPYIAETGLSRECVGRVSV